MIAEVVRQAPPPGFYAVIVLLVVLVAAWGKYVEHRFSSCKCDRPPTLLRPRWKKHDPKDDLDRYDDD